MAIGEDTSKYSGCAHYIKAFCTNAHKEIPYWGEKFGDPWTSDDPNHWAYWVKKAVIYGDQNGYSSSDTLQAVWYITDRAASYNDILKNIGYPSNGPDKNIHGYQGPTGAFLVNSNSMKLVNNKFNPIKNEYMTILVNMNNGGNININIYTIDGVLVKTLIKDSNYFSGVSMFTWNGTNDQNEIVASGIYLVRVEAPGFKDIKKACVLK